MTMTTTERRANDTRYGGTEENSTGSGAYSIQFKF